MKAAARYGIKPAEFYSMTIGELNIFLEAQTEKENDHLRLAMTQAYIMANLQRCKKMPEFKKFISGFEQKQQEPQSDEDLLKKVTALNAQFGGVVNGGST